MLARDLAEQVPVATFSTTGAEAVRLMAEYRLAGLVVMDAGRAVAVIPGSQLLALMVPEYIADHPNLSHVYDEQAADELCTHLNEVTLGGSGRRQRLAETKVPRVLPEDTVIEVAAIMLKGHYPLICVVDRDGTYSGVVTMSRLMAHFAQIAGQDSELVRRRLERDIIDRGLGWEPVNDLDVPDTGEGHATGADA